MSVLGDLGLMMLDGFLAIVTSVLGLQSDEDDEPCCPHDDRGVRVDPSSLNMIGRVDAQSFHEEPTCGVDDDVEREKTSMVELPTSVHQ